MYRKTFFLLLFLVVIQVKINAQNKDFPLIKFHHLNAKDGLSQNSVFSILQDKKGYMWFGTFDGLNRYDGYTFTKYKYDPKDSTSIGAASISCIFEDPLGKIWVGTNGGGLSVFNPVSEKFTTFKNNPKDTNSLSSNDISDICYENGSLLWVSTYRNGLNLFDTISKKSIHIIKDGSNFSLSSNNIRKMVKGKNGNLYLATRTGLNIVDGKTYKIRSFQYHENDSNGLGDNKLQSIYMDRQEKIWISTRNAGVFKFDPTTEIFKQYKHSKNNRNSISSDFINCVYQASNGLIWIGSYENGVNILNPNNDSIQHLSENKDDPYSLSNNHIFTIVENHQNTIWVGTDFGGVNLYHSNFQLFNSLDNLWGELKTPDHKNIFSIIEDDDNKLWIGTNGAGLFNYNMLTGELINFSTSTTNPNSISYNSVWSLLPFSNDLLIIGTNGKGFNILNKKTKKISRFLSDSTLKNTLSSNVILCFLKENDSLLWIGTANSGINIYNVNSGHFEFLQHNPENSNSISGNLIYKIYKTHDEQILVGTQSGGLNIYHKKTKSFKSFTHNEHDNFSISNNNVFCIFEDTDGIIWLGTNGGGLNAFDFKTQHFISFTERDGLPNNVIYAIEKDNAGNLWLSTNNGISRFTPPTEIDFTTASIFYNKPKQIKNFNVYDGISSDEFNQGASFQNKDGWIYFGNINGITRFHPDSIKNDNSNVNINITKFLVFGKTILLDSAIEEKKIITLKYNQNFFSFEFAALNFLSPFKNIYAVMMVGFDKTWNYTGTRRYASYTNLDPGEYDFKVKATNNDGIWSDKITSVHIIITPPFWKTTWFKILSTVLLISAVVAYFRYRVNNIRKEEQKKAAFEKELAEVEMKALRAQMNPHFIFNSLNSINKYIWANDQASASDYLARFSRLIRLIFENSMHQSVPLSSDLEALDLYIQMERLRFENKLDYTIKVDESIDQEQVLVPPLIFQPFVENAILHGIMPKGTMGNLTLNFNTTENELIVTIEDNGIGRAAAAEKNKNRGTHKSLGMKVTKDRLDLLNQKKSAQSSVTYTDLKDEKGNASGTKVEISMPLEYV